MSIIWHHEINHTILLSIVKNRHNMRMVKSCNNGSLPLETDKRFVIFSRVSSILRRRKNFDCHISEYSLVCSKNDTLPSTTNDFDQHVLVVQDGSKQMFTTLRHASNPFIHRKRGGDE